MKAQLIFSRHSQGKVTQDQPIPPLGLLTLAVYAEQEVPDAEVEVFDGNVMSDKELLDSIDADIVGFGTWFSNYDNALVLAEKVKAHHPKSKIVFGGPHMLGLAEKAKRNNDFIDYAIPGDGERGFIELLTGKEPFPFPDFSTPLAKIPPISLKNLKSPWEWKQGPKRSGQSFFPSQNIVVVLE